MKKKQILCFILIFEIITFVFCEIEDIQRELVKEGIFESTTSTFSKIDGSVNFINGYNLNKNEILLIGIWFIDDYSKEILVMKYGPGISITFLPNRYFSVFKNDRNAIGIKHIIGEWKIVNDELLVKFNARIVKRNSNENTTGELRVEKMETDYFKIFEVPDYELAYVNDKPFKWDTLPDSVIQFYDIDKEDMPRFRLLFDTLGVPPGDITSDSELGKLLLNPRSDDSYYLQLATIW